MSLTRILQANKLLVIVLINLSFLTSCEKPPKDWEIEYDDHILDFHGKYFKFNKPVLYFILNQSDTTRGYTPVELSIGKKLIKKRSIRALGNNPEVVKIKENETFKVLRSLWIRKDWWTGIFVEDTHLAILEDSMGNKSFTLISTLTTGTNRPEFNQLFSGH